MDERELLRVERRLWEGGPEEYRSSVDERCLLAFEGMAGVSSREEVVASVPAEAERWRDVDIEVEGVLRPTPDVAILTYRASASRGEEPRYRARVSSGYVARDGAWKLMFHHQTPLEGAGAAAERG